MDEWNFLIYTLNLRLNLVVDLDIFDANDFYIRQYSVLMLINNSERKKNCQR